MPRKSRRKIKTRTKLKKSKRENANNCNKGSKFIDLTKILWQYMDNKECFIMKSMTNIERSRIDTTTSFARVEMQRSYNAVWFDLDIFTHYLPL